MNTRIKNLVHVGNFQELKLIFEDKSTPASLIDDITLDDFRTLMTNDSKPKWEQDGYGTNPNQPFDPNYRYVKDWDNKLVIRLKRVPAVGAYVKCFDLVNYRRKQAGLEPLKLDDKEAKQIFPREAIAAAKLFNFQKYGKRPFISELDCYKNNSDAKDDNQITLKKRTADQNAVMGESAGQAYKSFLKDHQSELSPAMKELVDSMSKLYQSSEWRPEWLHQSPVQNLERRRGPGKF